VNTVIGKHLEKVVIVCFSESFIKICSLTFLDRHIAAGMPSSCGEDWQPLLLYLNSLVHGETDQPPVTSKRAYSCKKEYAGEVFLVIYQNSLI
jgi:cohesin complex subunit SA-1/2